MSLYYIAIIMFATGIFGGAVNYFSEANEQKENGIIKKLRSLSVCILFGLAATVLVPLFLKFAESRLLEDIHLSKEPSPKNKKPIESVSPKTAVTTSMKKDSLQAAAPRKDSTSVNTLPKAAEGKSGQDKEKDVASDYLIWTAYCLLAACAGMRFIDLLMSRVISKEYMNKIETEKQELSKQNKDLKKENTVATNNYKVSEVFQLQDAAEGSAMKSSVNALDQSKLLLSELPPIIHSNDPQKDRFGGKSSVNGKTLTADTNPYILPGFLNLTIKVSAAEGDLNSDVYLFLHNSFAKSIIHLDGYGKKEVEYKIPAYGAFTIGAILDNGNTLLELDLEKLENLPKDFRNR
ncbi:YEATS-associated helix-containing protein [Chryseobacterium sp. MIQD13]|uniref:YEATS-associated helix-containing protein n=1 Tax=Chryseobacterium sp. MIQD13 TaxID=3422310 RepID=UPI003D2C7FC0